MSYFFGESLAEVEKEYLNGAITVDKSSNGIIEMITFHFKDFPYSVTTTCNLIDKYIDESFPYPTRSVYESGSDYSDETIKLTDRYPFSYSWFIGTIEKRQGVRRSEYINQLVKECTTFYDVYSELAAEKNTTAITFYPKTIDGKVCTVLEYTQNDVPFYWHKDEPTNVIGLFMPLNETKDGCDMYLILLSINQTADWLDSVNVSKRETKE